MDIGVHREFMHQAQRGEHIRRLISQQEWQAVESLFDEIVARYDTVKGISSDKEWMERKAKVAAIEEVRSELQSRAKEAEYALSELQRKDEEDE